MQPAFGVDYEFTWEDLGDISLGRPNLGGEVPVLVYRLAQYTMREAIRQRYGEDMAGTLLREAGWIAGREFCKNTLNRMLDFNAFVAQLQDTLKTQKIGILRIEKADLETLSLVLTVSEDLDCSGLPVYGATVCDYDEGFIAGILHAYTGKHFTAVEVDCWATGDRTCRFEVNQDTCAV
jgi:uncharacterized protein